jgi:hypothetical protein
LNLIKPWSLGVRWGHNWKGIFLHKLILEKKIFSKTSFPISIKLDANYPCMKEIQACSDKGTDAHQRETITKCKYRAGSFMTLVLTSQ